VASRRAETSRESRLILLTTAGELFAEKGYQRTTFADVADRAGISRGSISWHFGNKEGLMAAVLEHETDELLATLSRIEQMSGAEVADYLNQLSTDGTIQRISRLFLGLYVEALKPDSATRDAFVAIHDRIRASVQAWVEQTLDIPEGNTSHDVAVLLFGAALGIDMQWLIAPDRVDTDNAFAAMRAVLHRLLKTQP